ncbi:hypothetical protein EC957_011928 [Mortierella hygrophila]|uniref:DDE Tnp4 domain-containing protein n=1 Tax=Mortierella hygrophila TaxID=979708 RepID=A0A9P6F806_9FUNG|nr:hypothetical protein EC957_011928 [Mortierella hygrophila]
MSKLHVLDLDSMVLFSILFLSSINGQDFQLNLHGGQMVLDKRGLGEGRPRKVKWGYGQCIEVRQDGQYNSCKKQNILNYQGVVATDRISIHLSEAFGGTHNDIEMFALTGMDRLLEEHAYDIQGRPLANFGDGSYQLGAHVCAKYDEDSEPYVTCVVQ